MWQIAMWCHEKCQTCAFRYYYWVQNRYLWYFRKTSGLWGFWIGLNYNILSTFCKDSFFVKFIMNSCFEKKVFWPFSSWAGWHCVCNCNCKRNAIMLCSMRIVTRVQTLYVTIQMEKLEMSMSRKNLV